MIEQIQEYIQSELIFGQEDLKIGPESDLLTSGMIDSLGMMQLIAFIEENCQVKIPFEDITIEHFMTLNDIGAYLEKRKSEEEHSI